VPAGVWSVCDHIGILVYDPDKVVVLPEHGVANPRALRLRCVADAVSRSASVWPGWVMLSSGWWCRGREGASRH
jgi:hypothetical protein